jgi:hypothetical protein
VFGGTAAVARSVPVEWVVMLPDLKATLRKELLKTTPGGRLCLAGHPRYPGNASTSITWGWMPARFEPTLDIDALLAEAALKAGLPVMPDTDACDSCTDVPPAFASSGDD